MTVTGNICIYGTAADDIQSLIAVHLLDAGDWRLTSDPASIRSSICPSEWLRYILASDKHQPYAGSVIWSRLCLSERESHLITIQYHTLTGYRASEQYRDPCISIMHVRHGSMLWKFGLNQTYAFAFSLFLSHMFHSMVEGNLVFGMVAKQTERFMTVNVAKEIASATTAQLTSQGVMWAWAWCRMWKWCTLKLPLLLKSDLLLVR